ncbi:hypothetical protein LIA77_06759 [Sarocladium implicatum]|nr:hypothetical protein LIA77_06759 [Sarocladium implicatum]
MNVCPFSCLDIVCSRSLTLADIPATVIRHKVRGSNRTPVAKCFGSGQDRALNVELSNQSVPGNLSSTRHSPHVILVLYGKAFELVNLLGQEIREMATEAGRDHD